MNIHVREKINRETNDRVPAPALLLYACFNSFSENHSKRKLAFEVEDLSDV